MAAWGCERRRSCVCGGVRDGGAWQLRLAAPEASRAVYGCEDQKYIALGRPLPFFSTRPTPRHAASPPSICSAVSLRGSRAHLSFFFHSSSSHSRCIIVYIQPSVYPFHCRCVYLVLARSLARSLSQLPSPVLVYL